MPRSLRSRPIDDEAQLRQDLLREAMATDYPIAQAPVAEEPEVEEPADGGEEPVDVPVPESTMTRKPLVHRDDVSEPPMLEAEAPEPQGGGFNFDISPDKYSRLSQIAYALGAGTAIPQDVLAKPKTEDRSAMLRQALLEARLTAQTNKTAKTVPGANSAVVDAMFALYPEQANAIGRDKLMAMDAAELKSVMPRITSSAAFTHKVGEDEFKHVENDRRQTGTENERKQVQTRADHTNMKAYEKEVSDLHEVASAMEEVERQAPGLIHGVVKGDVGDSLGVVPKILAKLPGGVGKRFTPEEQQKLRSAVEMLKTVFIQSKGGKNLTEAEIKLYNNILNSELMNTPQGQAAALDVLRRVIGNKLKKIEGAYRTIVQDQDLWAVHKANGGLTYTGNPLWKDMGEGASQPAVREPAPGAVPPPAAGGTKQTPKAPAQAAPKVHVTRVSDGKVVEMDAAKADALVKAKPGVYQIAQ